MLILDDLERLTKQGNELGYEGEELKAFVKEQWVILRGKRQATRDAKRETREAEREVEREKRDAIVKYEHEIKRKLAARKTKQLNSSVHYLRDTN